MLKITIQIEDVISEVSLKGGVTFDELSDLFLQCAYGAGFTVASSYEFCEKEDS